MGLSFPRGEGVSTESVKRPVPGGTGNTGAQSRVAPILLWDPLCLSTGHWKPRKKASDWGVASQEGRKQDCEVPPGYKSCSPSSCFSLLTIKSGSTTRMLGKGQQGCKNPEDSEVASAELEGRDPAMGKCIPNVTFVQN